MVLLHPKLLKFLRSLLQIMEFNGVNAKRSCGLTVLRAVIQEHAFLWLQTESCKKGPVNLGFRLDFLYLTGKDHSIHIFQKWHLRFPGAIQGVLAVVRKDIQAISLAFQIIGPGLCIVLGGNGSFALGQDLF